MRQLYDTGQLLLPTSVKAVSPLTEPARFYALLSALRHQPWVVYSKRPFAGPMKLLTYLGRYTHRVAISNARLLSGADGQVSCHYRDRPAGDIRKTMSLPADEFLRRFLCHVLPSGFQRIRHYGLLASRTKQDHLARCRQLLDMAAPQPPAKKTTAEWLLLLGIDNERCPRCGQRTLERSLLLPLPGGTPTQPSPPTTSPTGFDTS